MYGLRSPAKRESDTGTRRVYVFIRFSLPGLHSFCARPPQPMKIALLDTLIHRLFPYKIFYVRARMPPSRIVVRCAIVYNIGTHSTKTVRSEREKCAHTPFLIISFGEKKKRRKRTITVLPDRHLYMLGAYTCVYKTTHIQLLLYAYDGRVGFFAPPHHRSVYSPRLNRCRPSDSSPRTLTNIYIYYFSPIARAVRIFNGQK